MSVKKARIFCIMRRSSPSAASPPVDEATLRGEPKQMKELLHDRLLVGAVFYEPPRRRKPFTAGLQHRFYKDSSLEAHWHAEHRREHAIVTAEAKAAIVTRKMLREMQLIRRLQDKLIRQQGRHLHAGETLIAATLIQSAVRGQRARRRLHDAQKLRALRVIRKVFARYVERKRRRAAAEQAAGWSVRQRLAKLEAIPFLRCRMAATSIQSVWRLAASRQLMARRRTVRDVSTQFVEAVIAFATADFIHQRVRHIVAASLIQRSWRRTLRRIRAMEARYEWQEVKSIASTLDKACKSAPLNKRRHSPDKRFRGLRHEKSSKSPLTTGVGGKKSPNIVDVQRGSTESSSSARCAPTTPTKVTNACLRANKPASKPGRKPLRSAKTNEAENFEANEARKISPRRRQMPVLSRVLKAGREEANKGASPRTKNSSEKSFEKYAGDKPCRVVVDIPVTLDKVDLDHQVENPNAQLSCSRTKAESKQMLDSTIRSPNPPDVGPSARSLGLQSFRRSIGLAGNSPTDDEQTVYDDSCSMLEASLTAAQPASHLPAMQPRTTVEADGASQQHSSTLAQLAQSETAEDGSTVDAMSAIELSMPDLSIPKTGVSALQAEVSHDYTDDYEDDYEDEFSSEEG